MVLTTSELVINCIVVIVVFVFVVKERSLAI